MTETVRELQEWILTLPPDERAALLELLLASLEPKSAAQRAWAQLASRRREDAISGKATMAPGDDRGTLSRQGQQLVHLGGQARGRVQQQRHGFMG